MKIIKLSVALSLWQLLKSLIFELYDAVLPIHGYTQHDLCPYIDSEANHIRHFTKISKGAKIRNRYNQVPHLTHNTNGNATNSQLDTTNDSQEVGPFPAGDHKAHLNRRPQRHSKHKTEKNIKYPQKKYCLGTVSKIFYWWA